MSSGSDPSLGGIDLETLLALQSRGMRGQTGAFAPPAGAAAAIPPGADMRGTAGQEFDAAQMAMALQQANAPVLPQAQAPVQPQAQPAAPVPPQAGAAGPSPLNVAIGRYAAQSPSFGTGRAPAPLPSKRARSQKK